MTVGAYLGSAFRRGLPPGVYEDRPSLARPAEVRLDVAAFVGLTERGPTDRAVAIESFDAYKTSFGVPGGGRLLGQSVYLFFANGGRRCVVLRAVAPEARPARWVVPGVHDAATSEMIRLNARDPGAWGDRIEGRFRYFTRPLAARPAPAPREFPEVLLDTLAVEVGAIVRLVLPSAAGTPEEYFGEVKAIETDRDGKRIATLKGLPSLPKDKLQQRLAALQEVRLEIEIATTEVRERFTDLGLSRAHPRYALDILRGDPSRPDRPGSILVIPDPDGADPDRIGPSPGALLRGAYATSWSYKHLDEPGSDAADTTYRRDFFDFPGGISKLDLLDSYDEANELQPIGSVCMPDLVHPDAADDFTQKATPAPPTDPLRFGECTSPTPIKASLPDVIYPKLLRSYDLIDAKTDERSALDWQAELVARCEVGDRSGELAGSAASGRVAILDLPPWLEAGDVLRWRRAVASVRGAAALYAPYLRVAPAEDPLAALRVVPPCGAACGIVARRERALGIHAAPANEVVLGVVALSGEGYFLDAGFMHEARVNLIRTTERGPSLLGARTTSDDLEWTHLSVRRLVYWLERQLVIDTRWAVFEPNNRILWSRVARSVELRLNALLSAGALAGASASEAFFVRCTGTESRLMVEVGIAPAVPAEFIVFELVQFVDGRSSLEEQGG